MHVRVVVPCLGWLAIQRRRAHALAPRVVCGDRPLNRKSSACVPSDSSPSVFSRPCSVRPGRTAASGRVKQNYPSHLHPFVNMSAGKKSEVETPPMSRGIAGVRLLSRFLAHDSVGGHTSIAVPASSLSDVDATSDDVGGTDLGAGRLRIVLVRCRRQERRCC